MPTYERWQNTWRELGAGEGGATAYADLMARYAEPHRAYHNARHLAECFARLDEARGLATCPVEVSAALWFHDAVYAVRAHDNEERSAALAREVLRAAGVDAGVVDRISSLILATRHDATPTEPDARLLTDIDLAILGAAPARFDEYEAQIRAEYAWVPEPVFREKRREILATFLARERLFATAFFHDTLESRARANLRRSIEALA